MKQNQKNRYNGRYSNRNSKALLTRNTTLESTGPMGKLHGTALQLFEKYQAYAKDALIQNDLVLAQTCMQYADHYMRLQCIAITNEQNLRTAAMEQRSYIAHYAEKTEGDSLPEVTVESTDTTEQKAETPSESETTVQEEKQDQTSVEVVEKQPKKSSLKGRSRQKSAEHASEPTQQDNASPDNELDHLILNQDLSVPILGMQEKNS